MKLVQRLRRIKSAASFALTRRIGNLELHVAHSCNLTCESCSHYSNHNHKGIIAPELADKWMAGWAQRIVPSQFSLLGGEPAINHALADFLPIVRKHWPDVPIRIASNGFLLHRHPELPRRMAAIGRVRIELSVHHNSAEYAARLEPVLALLQSWEREFGIEVRVMRSFDRWTRRYHGFGANMRPFNDGDPQKSWDVCTARCFQLFEGAIWKCAPLAYLGVQNTRYDLSDEWDPYLAYQPLLPGCSDAHLAEFFLRQSEPACAMCAAQPPRFDLPLPFQSPTTGQLDRSG